MVGMNIEAVLDLLAFDPYASFDVAEVALRLAGDEYANLDVEAYLSELDGMAHEARAYMRGDLAARTTGLCRYLFHEMGFRGNAQDYYDARNSYLNEVLDRRTGIPLTLSMVAMAVGQRAGLEVVGVGLPGHFVAKAVDGEQQVFFDPFHGGRLLTVEGCEAMVARITDVPFRATAAVLQAASLGSLVERMLNNLKVVYWKSADFVRAARIAERLRKLLPNDPAQRRDLGICLLYANQPGRALDHLTAYQTNMPRAEDAAAVAGLVRQARSALARWN